MPDIDAIKLQMLRDAFRCVNASALPAIAKDVKKSPEERLAAFLNYCSTAGPSLDEVAICIVGFLESGSKELHRQAVLALSNRTPLELARLRQEDRSHILAQLRVGAHSLAKLNYLRARASLNDPCLLDECRILIGSGDNTHIVLAASLLTIMGGADSLATLVSLWGNVGDGAAKDWVSIGLAIHGDERARVYLQHRLSSCSQGIYPLVAIALSRLKDLEGMEALRRLVSGEENPNGPHLSRVVAQFLTNSVPSSLWKGEALAWLDSNIARACGDRSTEK